MTQPKTSAGDQAAAQHPTQVPVESTTHGMEHEPTGTSLSEDIRARTTRPHKGDVGPPETNEDIYQGSKMPEID